MGPELAKMIIFINDYFNTKMYVIEKKYTSWEEGRFVCTVVGLYRFDTRTGGTQAVNYRIPLNYEIFAPGSKMP
jgi:hypothetical protein